MTVRSKNGRSSVELAPLTPIDPPDHTAGALMYPAEKIIVQAVGNVADAVAELHVPGMYVVNAGRVHPTDDIGVTGWRREDGSTINLLY